MFKKLSEQLGLRASGKGAKPAQPGFDGAYRLHQRDDVQRFTSLAAEAYPAFASRIECFGANWQGCQYATDRARVERGEKLVLLLEPGTGGALEIPATFAAFHDPQLFEHTDAALALSFYRDWLNAGGAAPAYTQCVGYKRPLYLGGADNVSNLELGDFEVYWGLAAQLLAKVRGLPVGTRIGNVSIGDGT